MPDFVLGCRHRVRTTERDQGAMVNYLIHQKMNTMYLKMDVNLQQSVTQPPINMAGAILQLQMAQSLPQASPVGIWAVPKQADLLLIP